MWKYCKIRDVLTSIWISQTLWFIVQLEIFFYSYGDVTKYSAGKGLHILTYARHSWPLSSDRGFFSLPHLLWQGASVYNGHLGEPMTLTPIAKRLGVERSLPVFTNKVFRGWDSSTQPSACGTNALTHFATAAVRLGCTIILDLCLRSTFCDAVILFTISRNLRLLH